MNSFLDKLFRQLRLRKITKHIPKDAVVCDIGCGESATFLKSISSLIQKGIGLDEKIEDYRDAKLEIKNYHISESLPLADESCDVVTIIAVLEHLSKPQEILNECFRILKKEGKLILTTPTPLSKPILEFLAFKLHWIDENEIKDHKNYFWPKNVKEMLLKSGFQPGRIKNKYFEFCLNTLIVAQK